MTCNKTFEYFTHLAIYSFLKGFPYYYNYGDRSENLHMKVNVGRLNVSKYNPLFNSCFNSWECNFGLTARCLKI